MTVSFPRAGRAAWVAVTALCIGFYLFTAAAGGAALWRLPLFLLCALVYILLPGLTLADRLAPKDPPLRPLFAIVYGCALLALTHCIAVHLHWLWLLRLLPPLAGLPALRQLLTAEEKPRPPARSSVLLWALLLALYTVFNCACNPHPLAAGAAPLNQDMLWNVGNAAALCRDFPAQDLRFSGVQLVYHYLTDLLLGALSLVSGAGLYDIYAFFAGPLFLAAEVTAVRALAACFFGPDKKHFYTLAALLYLPGCASLWKPLRDGESIFGSTQLRHLVTNINAQATAFVFLAAFLCVLRLLGQQRFRLMPREMLTLLLSFALLCVAKGPLAAIIVCSFAVTMLLVLLFQKPDPRGAWLCLLGAAGIFVFFYQALYAAGAGSMEFSAFAMRDTYCYRLFSPLADRLRQLLPLISGYVWLAVIGIVDSFCMLPLQMVLWVFTLPAALRRLFRLAPERLVLNGAVVGGFLAYHLFRHTSSSQVYFALTAMLAACILAAEPAEAAWQRGGWRRLGLCVLGAAATVSTVCTVAYHGAQAVRQLRATVSTQEARPADRDVTAADEAAMLWLQQTAPPGAVFATNRISSTPDLGDSISNSYSALSGCQAYLEGWTYAMTNMGVDPTERGRRQWINDQMFLPQTAPEQVRAWCAEDSIRYLVLAKRWPGGVNPALEPVYENSDVAIYDMGG